MAPEPLERFAVLGLGPHHDPGAGQTQVVEAAVQLVGQRLGHEGGGVDPFGRRVELGLDLQLRRGDAGVGRALVESTGQAVGETALDPEAGQHVGGRQGGQVTERAHPEADEHVDQVAPPGDRRGPDPA